MASNWLSDIAWDERGRPYRTYLMDGPRYKSGDRTYVSPAEVHPENTTDPRLLSWASQHGAPGGSLLKNRGTWNSQTGDWDRGTNWGNLLSIGVGGAIAAPFIAPAVGGLFGGGGAAASSGTAAASGSGAAAGGGSMVGGLFKGLTLADLIKGGAGVTQSILGNRANNKALDMQSATDAEALAFAKQQYDEQKALEKARFESEQSRMAPYRAASSDALVQLRRLIGI